MTTSAADHDDPTKATITDVATLIASGAGAGLSPVAPGTAGSIVAAALLALLLDMPVIWHWWGWFGLAALAVWSSKRAGAAWGVIDHPAIVIDEFAGLWLAALIPMSVLTFDVPGMTLLIGSLLLSGCLILLNRGLSVRSSAAFRAHGASYWMMWRRALWPACV